QELADHIAWLAARRGDTVVVTNETGWGVVPAYPSGRVFRDALGRANAALCTIADAAYLVVNGRLVDLTSAPTELTWPGE
ncbi:MAG TPA: bifunctional adenosylcobinamide kinase/adenosylcobinamide-phosphate guanylyltransferase, partial [Coriobacteriia bacterium]|nr:bifunctional adenosylcobinamide kinase/adenosylcobinamide-phosphate guanylyltransferase [Coriobacteriia bacterium]